MGELAFSTPIPTHVSEYVAKLIVATHPESKESTSMARQFVSVGASPRGAQALIIGAKVNALLEGRMNVAYDDVTAIAHSALRHRILLNFEGQAEGISKDQIVTDLLEVVKKK
jgi:MoxR-like ATPase